MLQGGRPARWLGPLAIAGGVVTEVVVLHNNAGQFSWLPAVLVVGGLAASVVLALGSAVTATLRAIVLAAALGLLLLAPATWAVQTLGHATNGTFPTGGPASAGVMGGGPGGGGRRPGGGRGGGGFGGGPPAGAPGLGARAARRHAASGAPAPGCRRRAGRGSGAGARGPPGARRAATGTRRGAGGDMFGGDTQSLSAALAYAKAHGGGTVAVSSQSGAAGSLITSGASVAAIGGFSGQESQVSISWLADAVRDGRIRWVVTSGAGGGMRDGRVGSTTAMAAVAQACTPVSSVDSLYDCSQSEGALRAIA